LIDTNTLADNFDANGLKYKIHSENCPPSQASAFWEAVKVTSLKRGFENNNASSINDLSPVDGFYNKHKNIPIISAEPFVNNALRCANTETLAISSINWRTQIWQIKLSRKLLQNKMIRDLHFPELHCQFHTVQKSTVCLF
jgi:hypothetical protein